MDQERRKSYRCRVAADRQEALLRTRRGGVAVRIVDQSAEGLGLAADRATRVAVGEEVQLDADFGRIAGRVAFVQREGNETRIGLRFDRDMGRIGPGAKESAREPRFQAARFAIIVAACVAFAFLGHLMPDLFGSGDDGFTVENALRHAAATARVSPSRNELVRQTLSLEHWKSRSIIGELDLTLDQQMRVRGAVDDAIKTLAVLYEQGDPNSEEWPILGCQILASAWEEIDASLTPEQRAQWERKLEAARMGVKLTRAH